MIYIASNIEYDTDGEVVDLPTEIEIDVPIGIYTQESLYDYISNEISNCTDYCHNGFTITKKDNDE